jgi:hypothetical protein
MTPFRQPPRLSGWVPGQIGGPAGLMLFLLLSHSEMNERLTIIGNERLAAAIAEADRLDPGWRWEDLEKKRAKVVDEENSATRVLKVANLMPEKWTETFGSPVGFGDYFFEPPTAQFDAVRIGILRRQLFKVEAARKMAREIADFPNGRYASNPGPDIFGQNPVPNIRASRSVADLLRYDAILRTHENDINGALTSCRAVTNVARSFGDEPSWFAIAVRHSIRLIAMEVLQRSLAQGEGTEETLAKLQKALADEAAAPVLIIGLRGDRAAIDRYIKAVWSREISLASLQKTLRMLRSIFREDSRESEWKTGWQPLDDGLEHLREHTSGWLVISHAIAIEISTQWVEMSKLPLHLQKDRVNALEARLKGMPVMVRCLLVSPASMWYSSMKSQAHFRCAIASLAAERFRLAHGRWPATLPELVPAYLAAVPRDPFDNQELRYLRTTDGVIIYSIGHDCKDDGGDVLYTREKRPDDIGFRLWDVPKRRQAPMPPLKIEKSDEIGRITACINHAS